MVADPADDARRRLAALQAEESRREGQPPYRPLITGADVVDLRAYFARLSSDLVFPKTDEERAARQAAAERERAEEAAALHIRCDVHDADPELFCQTGTRDRPTIFVCDRRRALARTAAERAATERAECERQLERDAIAERLHESGVPERHCEVVLTGAWDDSEPLRQAREFYAGDSAALLLAGEMDTGKSGAIAWLLSQPPRLHRFKPALRRFHDSPQVLWVAAAELVEIDAWAEKGEERPRVLWSDLREAPRLAIDDIGRVAAVGKDESIYRRFTALLGERLERNLDTYMSTNLAKRKDLASLLEPQVWDRLQAWCDIRTSSEAKFRKAVREERASRKASRA